MPVLTETSKDKDGLGLEERVHAAEVQTSCAPPNPVMGSGKISRGLCAGMVAPPKKQGKGRPTSARNKPGYELSVPRTRFCSVCRSRGHIASACPTLSKVGKKHRGPPTCSNCGIVGHRKTN